MSDKHKNELLNSSKKRKLRHKLGIISQVTNAQFNSMSAKLQSALRSSLLSNGDKEEIQNDLSKIEIIDEPEFTFWYNRQSEIRRWNIFLNLSNLTFQIPALLNPKNDSHFMMNIYYTVLSMMLFAITAYSYKSKEHAILSLPVLFLLTIRQSFRIIDFEETKFNPYTPDDPN